MRKHRPVIRRLLRMAPVFVQGQITWDSFKASLRLAQKSVCLVGGGMMFCEREDECLFFQEEEA